MTAHEYSSAYRVPSDRIQAALLTARLAAQQKEHAHDAYKQALAQAVRSGAGYATIATVLGISRQAVRQAVITL